MSSDGKARLVGAGAVAPGTAACSAVAGAVAPGPPMSVTQAIRAAAASYGSIPSFDISLPLGQRLEVPASSGSGDVLGSPAKEKRRKVGPGSVLLVHGAKDVAGLIDGAVELVGPGAFKTRPTPSDTLLI